MTSFRPKRDDRAKCDKPNYVPCGNGDVSHEVCVLSSSDCPIDDIKISKEPIPGYRSRDLIDGYKIYFTTTSKSLPIVDFQLTEQHVCIFPNEYYRSEDREIYPLLRTWQYNGCERGIGDLNTDDRWVQTTSRSEADLISDNQNLASVIAQLKGYPITDSQYSLFTQTYVEWDWNCQFSDIASMNRIAEDNNPINTLANVQLFYCIISFLSLMIIGVISPGFVVYKQVLSLMGKPEADNDIIASNGMRLIAGIFVVLKG